MLSRATAELREPHRPHSASKCERTEDEDTMERTEDHKEVPKDDDIGSHGDETNDPGKPHQA